MYLKEEIEILTLKLLPHIWSFSFIIPVKAGWHRRLFPSCRPHLHLTHHTHTHPNTCHLSSVLGLWCDLSHQSGCGGSCLIKIKKSHIRAEQPHISRDHEELQQALVWKPYWLQHTVITCHWWKQFVTVTVFQRLELNREKMTSKILDFGVTPPVFVKIDNDNWLKM